MAQETLNNLDNLVACFDLHELFEVNVEWDRQQIHMLVSAEVGGGPPDFTACVPQRLVLVFANFH